LARLDSQSETEFEEYVERGFFYNATARTVSGYIGMIFRREDVTRAHLNYELNSDFEASLLGATEIQALVAAWQAGAISRDTLLHILRTGEIVPSARTNEQEVELIRKEPAKVLTTDGHGFEAERLKAEVANAARAVMAA